MIHTRAAEEHARAARAEADGVSVVMHCFSMPERLDECVRRGLVRSRSPATSRTRTRPTWRAAAARVPDERLLVETDAPVPDAAVACAASATSPRSSSQTAAFVAELRGVALAELGAAVTRNAARCSAG